MASVMRTAGDTAVIFSQTELLPEVRKYRTEVTWTLRGINAPERI